ncbi:MAG: DnaJ domain-containing protein [Chloroflexota bacterium]
MIAIGTERNAYVVLQVRADAHPLVVQAAYRVLAAIYHPDREDSQTSTRRMAELNDAYAKVRTPERRELYDREQKPREAAPAPVVVTPYEPVRSQRGKDGDAGNQFLDFGRYKGWSIAQLAQRDPDYLRWLSRHSSGIRYRRPIEEALRKVPVGPTASERVRGRRR